MRPRAERGGSEEAGAPAGIALALARRKWQFVTRWRLGGGETEERPSLAPLRRIFRATGGPVGRNIAGRADFRNS